MRIAISTGGGDAPGLNAVIRAAVLSALRRGMEIYGIRKGFGGLLGEARVTPLRSDDVRGITHLGGTILGTTNRGNPFRWPQLGLDGKWQEVDRSREVMDAFYRLGFDALIVVGGDGSLGIALEFCKLGLPVVGVPKTIDNDVSETEVTFGFDTAVATATEAIDKIHSTAESHSRVMVVEVMGRNAGWIALNSGLAGTADVILIPEIPFSWDSIKNKIQEREAGGRHFTIVVAAEGAVPREGGSAVVKAEAEAGGVARLGGIAELVANKITEMTGKETRTVTLGHLQRGGTPTTQDRLLALRFGAAAVRAVVAGKFGHMVAYHPPEITTVPLEDALATRKLVPLDSDSVATAREIGLCLGD